MEKPRKVLLKNIFIWLYDKIAGILKEGDGGDGDDDDEPLTSFWRVR